MFDYNREIYDNFINSLFDSSFMAYATVMISGEVLGEESIYKLMGDSVDAGVTDVIKKFYRQDLQKEYRIRVFPLEDSSLRITDKYQYTSYGRAEPYDVWLSVKFEYPVKINNSQSLFDFTDYIMYHGDTYRIQGVVRETFGFDVVLHLFLEKSE